MKKSMLNLDKNKKYLLACSYGPDSMYLLELLRNEGYKFAVAHVNYRFRKESDEEEKSLRDYCYKYNIGIYVYVNTEAIVSNLEEEAREIRYKFFKNVYDRDGFDALLVAHHKDDNLETYLMQKERKNLPNFYGISPETMINGMVVIRPLLDIYKEDIIKYNNDHKIPYSIDVTNLENVFLRNRIRNELLKYYNHYKKEQLAKEIEEENKKLSDIKCKLNDNDIHSIDFLLTLTPIEMAYALNDMVREKLPEYECSLRFVNEVKKVCSSSKSNVLIPLKDDFYLCKEYDSLSVRTMGTFEPIVVDSPCFIDNELFYFDLEKRGEAKGIKDYPITIRPYQKGDEYKIKNYSVPVNRLFIDWKMPMHLRKIWPLFVHDNEVIYIPRYQSDFNLNKDKYFYIKSCFALKK
ncbi:MAG: tRNA lysidine(34) synthetase TilS [Erysipelotrichaceae bacterium]|nr:tRNA lysidine(34) synthetase TilS [Erysipelotrichaceae bacterium]